MKKLFLLSLGLFSCSLTMAQRWRPEMQFGYVFSSPSGDMKYSIEQAHGMDMAFAVTNPSGRMAYGLELNLGFYGHESSKKELDMGNGITAPMEINVNNMFTNVMGFSRLNFKTEGNVRPYAIFKAGYAFYSTDLSIYDGDDWDSCEPVDSDVLYKDGAFVLGFGGGLMIDMSAIFPKKQKDCLFLNLQSSMTTGGSVNYMNSDAPAAHQHHTTSSDVMAEFINTQTQIVHEHHVGSLYNSTIKMIDFRLGLTFMLGKFY